MVTPKKTKSGKWQAKVFDYTDENGKDHYKSFTFNTKKEVEYACAAFAKDKKKLKKKQAELTLGSAIDKYIDTCCDGLSPTTIEAYKKVRAHAFQSIMDIPVTEITDDLLNEAIRVESKRCGDKTGKPLSAKTIKNEYGLISSALKQICKMTFVVKLPKIQHKNKELPEPEIVMQAVIGSKVELPCLLAMWLSFSMSEIRGLKCSSIHGDYIHVDQVMVDVGNEAVVKDHAKTDTRIRKQLLPEYIKELIVRSEQYQDYLATGNDRFLVELRREQIRHYYQEALKKYDLDISFHDLRHIFASVMLTKLQVPEKIVQSEGGWSTPHVMKSVYSNTFDSSRIEADRRRDEYFSSIIRK